MPSPPASPGTSPIVLYYDGTEVGAIEWNASGEEVLGGQSRAVVTIQDRANSDWEPQPHHDIKITIRDTGWVLWRGEVILATVALPLGMTFRRWTLQCADYSGFVRNALFGAPDGFNFWQGSTREPYISIDPDATIEGGDVSISDILTNYRPNTPAGVMDISTYVFTHTATGPEEDLQWDSTSTVGAALDRMASKVAENVQDWLDPDDKWHHQAIPLAVDLLADGVADDLDPAPAEIGPSGDAHHMGLEASWDGQGMVEEVFLQAATANSQEGGVGASGFYKIVSGDPVRAGREPSMRQATIGTDAWSADEGISVAGAALRRGSQPALRMTFTVDSGVDEWRAGQVVTLNDARLPPSLQGTHKFVIQRIAWSLDAGTDRRRYQIDVGDGPVSRANTGGYARPKPPEKPVKRPATAFPVEWLDEDGYPDDTPIGAGETRQAVAVTTDALGQHGKPAGVAITFAVIAIDFDPASPTYLMVIPDEGSFDPNPALTDFDGKARSQFTAGDMEGLRYSPSATADLP